MGGENDGSAEGSLAGVDSIHLRAHAESVRKDTTGHLDAEHLLVLLCLLSCSVHESLAVRDKSIHNATALGRN
jgi:hypothetical protein